MLLDRMGGFFSIPLREWTSCGYVFNHRISSDAEVAHDLTAFLHEEGVVAWEQRGTPSFPSFLRRRMFDGRIFWGGNAASFVEPLEATTIGHTIVQIRSAARWIAEDGRGRCAEADEIDEFNREMVSYVCRDLRSSPGTMRVAPGGILLFGNTLDEASNARAAARSLCPISLRCRSLLKPGGPCPGLCFRNMRTRISGTARSIHCYVSIVPSAISRNSTSRRLVTGLATTTPANPHSGHAISSGCIPMTNEDAIDLYNRVKVGTAVVVLP